MNCHPGLKVSIKEHGDYKGYLRNTSNLIIFVSESNLPSMWDCRCGSKIGQKLQTCSEVLLSFLDNLFKYSQSKYIKNPSFSHSNFLLMQRRHLVPLQCIAEDEGISNRFTRGWKNHSPPSFGRLYPTPCRLFNFRGDVPVLLKL